MPPTLASAWQQFCWVSSSQPRRDARSDCCWDPSLTQMSQRFIMWEIHSAFTNKNKIHNKSKICNKSKINKDINRADSLLWFRNKQGSWTSEKAGDVIYKYLPFKSWFWSDMDKVSRYLSRYDFCFWPKYCSSTWEIHWLEIEKLIKEAFAFVFPDAVPAAG